MTDDLTTQDAALGAPATEDVASPIIPLTSAMLPLRSSASRSRDSSQAPVINAERRHIRQRPARQDLLAFQGEPPEPRPVRSKRTVNRRSAGQRVLGQEHPKVAASHPG